MTDLRKSLEGVLERHKPVWLSGMGRPVEAGSALAVEEGCSCGAYLPCDAHRVASGMLVLVEVAITNTSAHSPWDGQESIASWALRCYDTDLKRWEEAITRAAQEMEKR